jgi:predicted ferric reductase
MKNTLTGMLWVLVYLLVALAPLLIVATAHPPAGRPFVVELSVALGFVGLAMMGLQFALIARFKPVAAPFGIDALTKFHKQVSFVARSPSSSPTRSCCSSRTARNISRS